VAKKDAPKKEKGKGKKDAAPADPNAERIVRVNAHPRARHHVATAKGWGGLAGFCATLLLSLKAGLPAFDAGLRALAGGMVLYLFAWMVAVAVWRQLAIAEVVAARHRLEEATQRRLQEMAAQRASDDAAAASR
jgi:hypothetical protein